ncbi:MAG: LamG domain-containing protein, partial [Bacteroidota bacterium]
MLGFCAFFSGIAQNGPGGIGDTSATSSLNLWLRADWGIKGSQSGQEVLSWEDQSANRYVLQAEGENPDWIFDGGEAFGGWPVISFSADEALRLDNIPLQWDAYTMYMVASPRSFPASWLQASSAGGDNWTLQYTDTASLQTAFTNPTQSEEVNYPEVKGTADAVQILWNLREGASVTAGLGEKISTTLGPVPVNLAPQTDILQIGQPGELEGALAEIIIFGETHTLVQRKLIFNYLQARYGSAMVLNNDLYTPPVPQTYRRAVVGIGSEAGNTHLQATSGALTLTSTPSGFLRSSGDYVMAGLNQQAITWTRDYVPGPAYQRWDADWYLDFTDLGTPGGALSMSWAYQAVPDTALGQHVLLFRAPGSERYEVLSWDAKRDADGVHFDLNQASYQDGFYTLGVYRQPGRGQGWTLNAGQNPLSFQQVWPENSGTLELWFNPSGFGNGRSAILGGYGGGEARAPGLTIPGGQLHWEFGGMATRATSQFLSTNAWYHLAMNWQKQGTTYDLELYLNGRLVDKATGVSAPDGLPAAWALGHYTSSPTGVDGAEGQTDELRIWSDVRTADEIRQGMCQTSSKTSGLHAYYTFDEPAGSIIQNTAGPGFATAPVMNTSISAAPVGTISAAGYPSGQIWENQSIQLSGPGKSSMYLTGVKGNPIGVHLYYVPDAINGKAANDTYTVESNSGTFEIFTVGLTPAEGQLRFQLGELQTLLYGRRMMYRINSQSDWLSSGASYHPAKKEFVWQGPLDDMRWAPGKRLDRTSAQPGAGQALRLDGET